MTCPPEGPLDSRFRGNDRCLSYFVILAKAGIQEPIPLLIEMLRDDYVVMEQQMKTTEKVFCGRMDHGGCGLLVEIEDGRIVSIKGDPDAPSKGYICRRGRAQIERLYHPDRLRYPQKRTGKKGENKWQRISWDEALDTISSKLIECKEKYGAESALFMHGAPKGMEYFFLYRLAYSYGSPNVITTGSVCFAPRLGAGIITNGYYPHPDLGHPPELILGWGSNHLATSADGVIAPEVLQAINGGSRLIYIDPVKRDLAAKSEVWLQIRPGMDGLLSLGMIKVIIEEELYDREFVERWTYGFDELKTHISSHSLKKIQDATWISENDIKKVARSYAAAESASILWGNAIDQNINSIQIARSLLILMALTGNLDSPGGNIQPGLTNTVKASELMLTKKYHHIFDKGIGKEFKLGAMIGVVPYNLAIKAILHEDPYKISFAYIQGTNPIMTYPNSKESFEAMKNIDFLAVADLFMTPTAQMADIVLPVATHFEFNDLGYFGLPYGKVQVRSKTIDPLGECWSDVKMINELALRLNLKDSFWKEEKECINYIFKPSGMDFRDLKKKGTIEGKKKYRSYTEKGFRTASGKVELYSSWMERNGYPPLPEFSDPEDCSKDKFDLILTSAKLPEFFHSMNRNISSLRDRHNDPCINIHPETADNIDVKDGDWIWVENSQGRIKSKAKLNSNIDPRVVVAEHGWWFPERDATTFYGWMESNLNVLTRSDPPYEPSLGTVNLRGFCCRLYKV